MSDKRRQYICQTVEEDSRTATINLISFNICQIIDYKIYNNNYNYYYIYGPQMCNILRYNSVHVYNMI